MVRTRPELGSKTPWPYDTTEWPTLEPGAGQPKPKQSILHEDNLGHASPPAPWPTPHHPQIPQPPQKASGGRSSLPRGPGPSVQDLKPAWSLNAPIFLCTPCAFSWSQGLMNQDTWAVSTVPPCLSNVLGVGSTTALSLVVWTVFQGCPDPRKHLAGKAEGWVQAGLGSEQDGCSKPTRGSSRSWGHSWLLLVTTEQLLVPPSSEAEARGAKTQDQVGKILLLGWTLSTHQSMIK